MNRTPGVRRLPAEDGLVLYQAGLPLPSGLLTCRLLQYASPSSSTRFIQEESLTYSVDLVSIDSRSPDIEAETTERLLALEEEFQDEMPADDDFEVLRGMRGSSFRGICNLLTLVGKPSHFIRSPFIASDGNTVTGSLPYAIWLKFARQTRLTIVQTIRGFHRLKSDTDKLIGLFLNVFLLGFMLSLVYTNLGMSSSARRH